MAVLTGTTGLLLALVVVSEGHGAALAVAHLGSTDFDLDAILAADAFDVDFEMQLAHAGDDGFAGLFVGGDVERRVFLAEALEGLAELVGVVARRAD